MINNEPTVRKYARRGKPHKHRCSDCKFLWPCSVADCRLADIYPCYTCTGHFLVVTRKK